MDRRPAAPGTSPLPPAKKRANPWGRLRVHVKSGGLPEAMAAAEPDLDPLYENEIDIVVQSEEGKEERPPMSPGLTRGYAGCRVGDGGWWWWRRWWWWWQWWRWWRQWW